MTPNEWVEELKKYCNYFKRLPSGKREDKAPDGNLTSKQLYGWLIRSGYIGENFKYREELKKEIDNLFALYDNKMTPKKWTQELKKYCNHFKEWPSGKREDKAPNGNLTSKQLYNWLIHSGYIGENFKYGEELKKEIDDLELLYNKRKRKYITAEEEFGNDSVFTRVQEGLKVKEGRKNGK